MLTELSNPVHMLTPKGKGWAYWAIDYGPGSEVLWGVVLDGSGEIWFTANPEVRVTENYSMGTKSGKPPARSIPLATGMTKVSVNKEALAERLKPWEKKKSIPQD